MSAIVSALEGAAWTADTSCPLGLLEGLQGPHLLLECNCGLLSPSCVSGSLLASLRAGIGGTGKVGVIAVVSVSM